MSQPAIGTLTSAAAAVNNNNNDDDEDTSNASLDECSISVSSDHSSHSISKADDSCSDSESESSTIRHPPSDNKREDRQLQARSNRYATHTSIGHTPLAHYTPVSPFPPLSKSRSTFRPQRARIRMRSIDPLLPHVSPSSSPSPSPSSSSPLIQPSSSPITISSSALPPLSRVSRPIPMQPAVTINHQTPPSPTTNTITQQTPSNMNNQSNDKQVEPLVSGAPAITIATKSDTIELSPPSPASIRPASKRNSLITPRGSITLLNPSRSPSLISVDSSPNVSLSVPISSLPPAFAGARGLKMPELIRGHVSSVTLPSRLALLGRKGFRVLASLKPLYVGNSVLGYAHVWNKDFNLELFLLPWIFSKSAARMGLFVRLIFLLLLILLVIEFFSLAPVSIGRVWVIGTSCALFTMYKLCQFRRAPDGVMAFCRSMGAPEVEGKKSEQTK